MKSFRLNTARDPELSRLAALEAAERVCHLVRVLNDEDILKAVFCEAQKVLSRDLFAPQNPEHAIELAAISRKRPHRFVN